MKFIFENVESELLALFSSIRRDPESWVNWHCLHIEAGAPVVAYSEETLRKEVYDVISRCFQGVTGTVLFVGTRDIYIFCKDMDEPVVKDAGQHVSRFINDKTKAQVGLSIWDLKSDIKSESRSDDSRSQKIESDLSAMTKVLLVEDDPVTRWMVRSALEGHCTLMMASTGGAAVESYHKCKPEVVFLDINLPDRTGDSVLKSIFDGDPGANVVVFSSQDNAESMVRMIQAGASGFVSKPFTRQRLLSYIRKG